MGDSIFDSWDSTKHGGHPEFFTDTGFLNRGKSGQVTAQMLERFERDVIANSPEVVIICAGTNDIAQNKGYVPNRLIMKNIKTMARMAEKSGIRVILCTILPAAKYRWRPEIEPVAPIRDMNRRIERFARCRKRGFIDFYTPLAATDGSLPESLSKDGVHPNSQCYDIMEKIVLEALR
jgi:lysophospholipase L1-like esterase